MGVARFQGVKVGTIVPMGYLLGVGDRGYLPCDGTTRNIADFPRLAAKLGTTWGGDGVTTFGLPESRGEALRGLDQGRGIDAGRVLGTYQAGRSNNLEEVQSAVVAGAPGTTGTIDDAGGWSPWTGAGDEGADPNWAQRYRLSGGETLMRNFAAPFYIKT